MATRPHDDPKLANVPHHKRVYHRVGGWLPKDQRVVEHFLSKRIAKVEHRGTHRAGHRLHPVLQEFQTLIEGDPALYMGFHQMFEQVPTKSPYNNDQAGKPQVRDYKMMLALFDTILMEAPNYDQNDLVGVPITAIMDWPMGTPAGLAMFSDKRVNAQFKKMFDVWFKFLSSPESCYVLSTEDNGWFCPQASALMPNMAETYVCDPDTPYHGFKSWDDFFTREFRPGVRPLEATGDEFIASAFSFVYCRATDVKEYDHFWLKGQPYSLAHMLNNDEYTPQFIGGSVYQAFLSVTTYHRWHSPVNGTVEKVVMVPGTYYAESPALGLDPVAPINCQAFATAMSTRALVFIRADHEPIGLMCFMAVGMCEVSSCEVTVAAGQKVNKGDQLGMFHFGGSTHCLIFRPETKLTFNGDYKMNDKVLLHAVIAVVSSST